MQHKKIKFFLKGVNENRETETWVLRERIYERERERERERAYRLTREAKRREVCGLVECTAARGCAGTAARLGIGELG